MGIFGAQHETLVAPSLPRQGAAFRPLGVGVAALSGFFQTVPCRCVADMLSWQRLDLARRAAAFLIH